MKDFFFFECVPGPTSRRREFVAKFPRTPGAEKSPWRRRASPPGLPSTVLPLPAPPVHLWRRRTEDGRSTEGPRGLAPGLGGRQG